MTERQLIIKQRNQSYYQANKEKIKVKYRPGKQKYYKNNKEKVKSTSRKTYFKDPEKWKAYGRAQRKLWRENEKEKLIKDTVDRLRVRFFDEEFIPDEEERVIKPKRKKRKKIITPKVKPTPEQRAERKRAYDREFSKGQEIRRKASGYYKKYRADKKLNKWADGRTSEKKKTVQ